MLGFPVDNLEPEPVPAGSIGSKGRKNPLEAASEYAAGASPTAVRMTS